MTLSEPESKVFRSGSDGKIDVDGDKGGVL